MGVCSRFIGLVPISPAPRIKETARPAAVHTKRTKLAGLHTMRRKWALARIVVITAAQLSAKRARMREERPRGWRPIEPGEPHAVLASAGDGQADHRRVLTTAPRAISGSRWPSARHSRLSAAPRPHRVRRLLARRCGDAAGRVRRHDLGPHRPMIVLGPALILSADPACEPIPD